MKTWITYIAAILMGLATALLFGDAAYASGILSALSSFLVSLGTFITIPVIVFTLPSGIASLAKNRKGGRTALAVILWSIAAAILLSAAAAIIYAINPVQFPVTSTAGSAPGALSNHVSYMLSASGSSLYPMNAFWSIATATYFIVPVLIISWILGLAIKPSADIIRPAYTVMNSFAEVMYRVSRTYTVYGFFLAYIASASLFIDVYQEKTLFAAPGYAKLMAIVFAISVLIILPLLFGIFTRFKKNPYRILYRSAAAVIAGFATGNIVTTIPMNESIARQNNGIQKRVASSAIPFFAVIGRGGSAAMAVISILPLFQATTGSMPEAAVIAIIAGTAALISLASSAAIGTEIALITVLSLNIHGINLYGAENALIAILPLLGGFATALDAYSAALGSAVAASFIDTDTDIPYNDII